MRKRASRPHRFAAVENKAIDELLSILATGLLTKLIRARDGEEVTVDGLCRTHVEGREALTKAMRMLVDKAFVVKFKIQRAASEMVEENGELVAKRGGSWYTTFSVDSVKFTVEDVAAMLAEIYAGGNVRAHRIEPEYLDPKKNGSEWSRPTAGNPSVGATCENAEHWPEGDLRPTYGSPTVGPPTVGRPAAHIRKKTVLSETEREDEMPLAGRSPGDVRRTSTSGSSAREAEGGSAASSKNQPSPAQHDDTQQPARGQKGGSKKAVHTAAELKTVRAVRAFFPAGLLSGWTSPETGQQIGALPDVPSLSQAILDALAGDVPGAERTVAQLGARIQQRWNHHGWASKYYAGEIDSLVGAAVAMVRPLKASDRYGCANPRCEAGADVDTGEGCTVCPERITARKAERARPGAQEDAGGANSASLGPGSSGAVMPPQRDSRDFSRGAECDGRDGMCGNPTAPGSDLCWRCAAEDVNQGIPAPF
ncbi:hypothetical protein AB0E67_27255 [Streptomyces sp. NPDC032161]|uniref:hypothetical protein n=1 Tax=unclassified Streptomyces TaxID=2593676 RepID=UPI00340CD438